MTFDQRNGPPYVVSVIAMRDLTTAPQVRTYGPFTMGAANMLRRELLEEIARKERAQHRTFTPTIHITVTPVADYSWRADVPWVIIR